MADPAPRSETTDSEPELRDYLGVLRRRAAIIVAAVVVVVGTAVVVSLVQTPVYQGEAELLLRASRGETLFDPNSGQPVSNARAIETEIQVLTSSPVRERVRQRLGGDPTVTVAAVGNTDVVAVRARHTDPPTAAAIANAYAEAYLDFKREGAIEELLAASSEVQAKIDQIQVEIDALDAVVDAADPESRAAVQADLAQRRDALVSQQSAFRQTLDQIQVNAALSTGGAQFVAPADVPTDPVEPKPVRNAVLALLVGLAFGVGLAFLFDYLDDSVKDKRDVERAGEGLTVVGIIPAFGNRKGSKRSRRHPDNAPPVVLETSAASSEAYRSLRTSVQFMGLDEPLRVLQITSPSTGEGKTTTLANLGLALAKAGTRVALVDFDLRRPRLHEAFGLDNEVGFTSVLLGRDSLARALRPAGDDRGYLAVLTSGPVPPNPSELLSSQRAQALLAEIREQAEVVLVDTPPVLPVTDALVVSRSVDAVFVVASVGSTTRRSLRRAMELLRQVGAPVRGAVLNRAQAGEAYGYGYGYGYGSYGSATTAAANDALSGNGTAEPAATWATVSAGANGSARPAAPVPQPAAPGQPRRPG